MKKIFGNKEIFAIGYKFFDEVSTEGSIYVWVDGKDLCSFEVDGDICGHIGNLYHIPEWFCDQKEYVFGYDPYPLPVEGKNYLELDENAHQYENSDELEEDVWYRASKRWDLNHTWFWCRDGAIFPCVFFWRCSVTQIELAWDNVFWQEKGINFLEKRGVARVPYESFKKTLLEFIFEILDDVEVRVVNKKPVQSWRKMLSLEA